MQLPCQGRRVAVSHHRSVPLPSHLFITHLSSLQSLCSEKTILSVISWIFLHFLSSWHLPYPVKMDSEALWPGPSSRDGPEEEPDTRTVTFSGLALLSLLASSQLLFSSSNSCTISFSSLASSSFFRHLLTRKKRGRDVFLLKMKLLWNHGVLPVSGVAPTGRQVGCTSGPFLLLPSYPGLLFRHQCPPTYPPAQVSISLCLSPLVSEIFWSPNWDAWQRRFSHLWIYLLDKPEETLQLHCIKVISLPILLKSYTKFELF